MTEKLRRIMTRQSEVREALNAETAKENPEDSTLTDLRGKAQGIEGELREALQDTADGDEVDGNLTPVVDSEERERREIRSRAKLTTYLSSCANGLPLDGAESEYAAANGCSGAMPLSMLEPPDHREIETRAITAGQDVPAGSQSPIPYVFRETISARLGVSFPSVPVGQKSYPVLGTPTAGRSESEGCGGGEYRGGVHAGDSRAEADHRFSSWSAARIWQTMDGMETSLARLYGRRDRQFDRRPGDRRERHLAEPGRVVRAGDSRIARNGE